MRLELSSQGRYALRALVYLARADGRMTADEIAEAAHIPRRLLARVLAQLSQAGLVTSNEGRGGGSQLARPPETITLANAVRAIEGPFGVTKCILRDQTCGRGGYCAMHEAWLEGQRAILDYLETRTLAELAVTKQPASQRSPTTKPVAGIRE